MKTHTPTLISLIASLTLIGCSQNDDSSAQVEEEMQSLKEELKQVSETQAKDSASLKSQLADNNQALENKMETGLQSMKESVEKSSAKITEDLKSQLAEQTKSLTDKYAAENAGLKDQIASLTEKFNALKGTLPENVSEPLAQYLPKLNTSASSLESMLSGFSPSSVEQINEFKVKYEKELGVAKSLYSEAMKLVGDTKLGEMADGLSGKIPSL